MSKLLSPKQKKLKNILEGKARKGTVESFEKAERSHDYLVYGYAHGGFKEPRKEYTSRLEEMMARLEKR